MRDHTRQHVRPCNDGLKFEPNASGSGKLSNSAQFKWKCHTPSKRSVNTNSTANAPNQ